MEFKETLERVEIMAKKVKKVTLDLSECLA